MHYFHRAADTSTLLNLSGALEQAIDERDLASDVRLYVVHMVAPDGSDRLNATHGCGRRRILHQQVFFILDQRHQVLFERRGAPFQPRCRVASGSRRLD